MSDATYDPDDPDIIEATRATPPADDAVISPEVHDLDPVVDAGDGTLFDDPDEPDDDADGDGGEPQQVLDVSEGQG